jgi:hypothetical protein
MESSLSTKLKLQKRMKSSFSTKLKLQKNGKFSLYQIEIAKRMESSLSLLNWNCKKNGKFPLYQIEIAKKNGKFPLSTKLKLQKKNRKFPLSTKLKLQKEWKVPSLYQIEIAKRMGTSLSLPNWNCKKEWNFPLYQIEVGLTKQNTQGSKLSKENDKWDRLISFQYVLFQFFSHCEIGGESLFCKLFPLWNNLFPIGTFMNVFCCMHIN